MSVLLKHQPWDTVTSQPARGGEIEWNMWTRRDPPYHDLDVSTRIILVSGGGPGKGTLTWEVQAAAVAKGRYESHEEAWRFLRRELGPERLRAAGLTRRSFLTSEYTARAPSSGWLLAWAYTPLRELMLPRPEDLRFQRNGWAIVDSIVAGSQMAGTESQGQGRISDPVLRRIIELEAMRHVKAWLRSQGHRDIRDTSATKPYDLEVGPDEAPAFRVEVKGTTGALGPVHVTANEVRSARNRGVTTLLAVVYGIRLTLNAGSARWQASGGQLHVIDPWLPDDRALKPIAYAFDPLA